MKIPPLDLKRQYASIKNEIDSAIQNVLNHGGFVLGPEVKGLENKLAEYCETKNGVGVASGTDALLLSLMAVGIKPGDEVITSTFTFFATAGVISRLGAKPVFVDIDPDTFNINPELIEKAITSKTGAIIPVHLYGQIAAMDEISAVAKKHNIPVILARVHSLPLQADDDYDQPYKSAAVLVKNGILVALENSGSMERMNGRNLPFYAGTVSSYGLSNEEALQLITLNPAKILGIEDRYGSLEIGKSATLFISDGNALEMKSNQLSHAFIDGRAISLESHQTELWKRYMKKYEASSE